jgi:signal transduction histidine kinase/ActR/RegA family two-component response regulator
LPDPTAVSFDSVAPAALDDTPVDQLVRQARIRMLYSHVRVTVLVAGVFAALMCWLIAPMLGESLVWPWLVVKCMVLLPRWAQAARYVQASNRAQEHWYRCALLLAFLDGLVWGAGTWLLAPLNRIDVAAITISSMMGIAAVGSFMTAIDVRAVAALTLPMLGPNIAYCLMRGDRFGLFGAFGLLVFEVIVLLEAKRAQRRIVELLTLRYTTERVAREREQALALAEHHSEAKSRFLATMSHEMRTPLHGILGLARMLHDDEVRPLARNRLELLQRSGDHLLTVINDVLDFSKIEAGYLRVESKRFELSTLVDEIIGVLSVSAAQKGLRLTVRYELPRPCTVLGDPARLRQVALNLLGNAIKFTEHGSVTLSVGVDESGGERGLVRFAVQDTGIGIEPQEVARIFDAFHQVESSFARRHAGTGLGLTISRKLCQAMGGELSCASRPDEGSIFTFVLPLPRVDEPAAAAPEPDQPGLWAGPGVHVLLVEDNPVNALVAEAILQHAGVAVTTVSDGLAAVEWLDKRHVDLVLMDCQMPGMDGFEATRQIRRREQQRAWQRVPVVALTANAHDTDRQRCLEAGMDDHLAKPFSKEALLAVLERYVGGQPFEERARA